MSKKNDQALAKLEPWTAVSAYLDLISKVCVCVCVCVCMLACSLHRTIKNKLQWFIISSKPMECVCHVKKYQSVSREMYLFVTPGFSEKHKNTHTHTHTHTHTPCLWFLVAMVAAQPVE